MVSFFDNLALIQDKNLLCPLSDGQAVGDEKGYTYILNPQVLLYKGNDAVDATDFVKAKLGIK